MSHVNLGSCAFWGFVFVFVLTVYPRLTLSRIVYIIFMVKFVRIVNFSSLYVYIFLLCNFNIRVFSFKDKTRTIKDACRCYV